MQLIVNGQQRETTATTVADLVGDITGSTTGAGIAVAIGDTVLPRSEWTRPLNDGDTVEILTAVQGG
ncbi:sulfur carrier protein ThiS [Corynebacterium sp. SCR221107]|uniref:sulfur carrier protein ThiS n=1 Tax=Corynebacterium sp. SCR221107 TaxID=3017361 RepID=UPI0022EC3153|nr:sulfur carrier protein ThiS [Corynebacterium sp. SCR221107]WBT07933.1 sulfur carrier protein ThiS [Corynebacterium sp. SCR221107]